MVKEKIFYRQNERAGAKSFAILLDENNVYLAHSTAPELLFKSIVPLPFDVIIQREREEHLLSYPIKELVNNESELGASHFCKNSDS